MFFIYVIIIPLVIFVIGYILRFPKPSRFYDYIILYIKLIPYFFCYCLLLYFLEMESIIKIGWVFYTLSFFLIPITGIVLLFRFYFWLKKKESAK
jgi:hypothetical protein